MSPEHATAFAYDALPGHIVFASGSSHRDLAAEISSLGAERLFVLFAEAERELARRPLEPLAGLVAGTFSEIRPHVPAEVVARARTAAEEVGADLLLSIGGGSTTGTAKAIALELGLPIAAVPTTYAGSEVTPIWGVTEAGHKQTGRSLAVLPKLVVYDPELTLSLPPEISGPSGINAMAHCVEAFYAPGANPVTSLLAAEGIGELAKGLPAAVAEPDDLRAREHVLYGAYLAGSAFAVAGSGIHHKICHLLGGAFDLPHAETHTVLLPQTLAFNEPAMPAITRRIALALGGSGAGEVATSAAGAVFDLVEAVGAPTSLEAIGLPAESLGGLVDQILEAVPPSNPRRPDRDSVAALLEAAFDGRRPVPSTTIATNGGQQP